MSRSDLGNLAAFVAVADRRSFRAAAAQLGVTPSALSHSMRQLEERLGARLLNRTTLMYGLLAADAGKWERRANRMTRRGFREGTSQSEPAQLWCCSVAPLRRRFPRERFRALLKRQSRRSNHLWRRKDALTRESIAPVPVRARGIGALCHD
jgi:hypothetical protein